MEKMLNKMKETHGLTDSSMDQIKTMLDEQLNQQQLMKTSDSYFL